MQNNKFAHLHIHTEYSQLDGFGSPKNYIANAKEMEFEHIAITDHGNIDGVIKFQQEAEKQGIKSIIGCELYIVNDMSDKDKARHITVLVKNKSGWKTLCSLLTKANLEGFYRKPRIDISCLLSHDLSGLIFMTGCANSFIEDSRKLILDISKRTEIYFEIMPHNENLQKQHNEKLIYLKRRLIDLPFVATNDCHYIKENQWESQEVLLAIQRRAKWTDKDRWKFDIKGLHLRSADEMIRAFEEQGQFTKKQIYQAMKNTIKIAEKCCDFKIEKRNISLPVPPQFEPVNDGLTGLDEKLNELCKMNVKKWNDQYRDRYDHEFNIITKKGFAKYFLIVYDLIEWCRKNDIMVGPGRGSVGGSLIAYLLGITKIDPIKYGLLFSRFISEDRIDYPDIDLDFEDRKREQVRKYLEETYPNGVCGISTFITMKSKGVIRDVSRVFNVPEKYVDPFAKAINQKEHEQSGIQWTADNTQEGKYFKNRYENVIGIATELENQIKSSGQHAAGIIVSNENLKESDRLNLCRRKKGVVVCNWGMEDCEYMGLVKIDILGLNTLSVISECQKMIQKKLKQFNIDNISPDDKNIFQMLSEGNTIGVFQLSAFLSTEIVQKVKIDNFNDVAACCALPRPGPMESGMTDEYIERKHSGRWQKKHPIYEKITKETYGLLVYQEQVMKVISQVAGLSESTADEIRKVIGKKRDPAEFKQYKEKFIQGCKEQKTLSQKEANEFWDGLLKWARYGFSKSHAYAYGLIAYQTSYLKYYYPKEFICSALSFGKEDNKNDLVKEAKRIGFQIITPKIEKSDSHIWKVEGSNLYVPFVEIKSIGDVKAKKCAEMKITKNENKGFFEIKEKQEAKTSLEKLLIDIGAFDQNKIADDSYFSFETGSQTRPSIEDIILLNKRFKNKDILKCKACELREQCTKPVLPSYGKYNVMILGEAPGFSENKRGVGFIGDAGNLLWREIKIYGYNRRFFHITNACKCYPKEIKTPRANHIKACYHWLEEEIKELQSQLILGCGNIPLYALKGEKTGITKLSGMTEWLPGIESYVCWCVHPSSVLHNRSENREYFEKGIKNFIETLEKMRK